MVVVTSAKQSPMCTFVLFVFMYVYQGSCWPPQMPNIITVKKTSRTSQTFLVIITTSVMPDLLPSAIIMFDLIPSLYKSQCICFMAHLKGN